MKLLYNANIHTLDSSNPQADSILIARERILAVGQKDKLESIAHGKVEKIDMKGKTILPGLTDAHIHIQHYALGLSKIDCETKTKTECLQRVAEKVKNTKPNEWVLGHGWTQNQWAESPSPDSGRGVRGEGDFPTKEELDAIAPNNPVYLTAKSLHMAWVNTVAIKLANITNDTPNPKDGAIERDASGKATGILLETAMGLVSSVIPKPTISEIEAAIESAQKKLWAMGITGIHDFDRRESFMALQSLQLKNKLRLRVYKNIPVESVQQANQLGLKTGFGNAWLWIGSVKAFMDGALGPRTAAMFQPYENESNNTGILNMDGEELFEYARQAADVGLSMTVHAIGDKANHEVLNAYEQLRDYETKNNLPHLRHRIEHVQIIHPDDAARLAKLNVIASMQPIHATSDMYAADKLWGERAKFSYGWRTQLNFGAVLTFGSDAPVESPNPFLGLHAAVTRRRANDLSLPDGWYPNEKISLLEALSAYTIGAAYTANAENRLGKLAENYLTDLIVLDDDPFKVNPNDLWMLKPSAVMINGQWVLQ